MNKKYLAEFVGTMGLTLAVLTSLAGTLDIPTPVVAALTLGLFVYTLGPVSGAHLNPAITLGLLSIKKITRREAIRYIAAQFVGAAAAWYVAGVFIVSRSTVSVTDSLLVGVAEFVGTVFFSFGVAAAVSGRVPSQASGAVVGGSLLLGIVMASTVSNGVLNPAVAAGIGSLSFMYVVAPIIGSWVGMKLFSLLSDASSD